MGAHEPHRSAALGAGSLSVGSLSVGSLTLRTASVVVDVPAVTRPFTYSIPAELVARVQVGTIVRVPLHGRRVRGWVVELDVDLPAGVDVVAITKVTGAGPSPEMIELCRWASWRWAGRLVSFLRMASPATAVPAVRPVAPKAARGVATDDPLIAEAFDGARAVLRLPPADDLYPVVAAAASAGDALVVCPGISQAIALARRLRADGVRVAVLPDDWAMAARGGCTVVGARGAAFAPMPALAAVVVLDEHDEALQSEASPSWHAREVCLERARRARVRAVMVSPTPSLESTVRSPLVTTSRTHERHGWPIVDVIDRRDDDIGRTGLYSERLVALLRGASSPVCVLNRIGRSMLLACAACGTLARCEACDAAVAQRDDGMLVCRRCGTERPAVCMNCGATKLKNLRQGVSRAAEELEALVGPDVRIGTEAILHETRSADVVAFLEFDQELLAPRYRAAEQAMTLLARAARLTGGRDCGGRVVVQTREPDHDVIRAAVHADPSIVSAAEDRRRRLLRYPPATSIAIVGGEAAPAYIESFGAPLGVEVLAADDGQWMLRADDRAVLLDALAATERPSGRLRLHVDPMRIR